MLLPKDDTEGTLHDTDNSAVRRWLFTERTSNNSRTSAGIGDGIDRVPPLVVVTAAAIRMDRPRISGALFSQHLDRLTQFVQLVILRREMSSRSKG